MLIDIKACDIVIGGTHACRPAGLLTADMAVYHHYIIWRKSCYIGGTLSPILKMHFDIPFYIDFSGPLKTFDTVLDGVHVNWPAEPPNSGLEVYRHNTICWKLYYIGSLGYFKVLEPFMVTFIDPPNPEPEAWRYIQATMLQFCGNNVNRHVFRSL